MDQAAPRTDITPRWFRTWKLPLAIWAAAGAFVAFVALNDETLFPDGGWRSLMYMSAVGGTVLLTSAWFGLLSTYPKKVRQFVVGAELAAVGLFFATRRIEKVENGNIGFFTTVWRWSKPADYQLEKLKAEKTDEQGSLPGLADYSAFLGPNRHAVVTDIKLARDWEKQPPRKLWRHSIGAGWSAFSVVGTAAVTQEQRGDEELVVCYDVPTGKVRWAHADAARFESILGGHGPRATPTIQDGRVYTIGSTGILNCLDLATGKALWKTRNVIEDVGSTLDLEGKAVQWGRAGSPLIVDDRVILPGGGAPLPSALEGKYVSLIAYDKNTGEKVATGGNQQISYSSPSQFTLDGVRQIVIMNEATITGHDAETLKTLWSYPWPGGSSNASTPQTQQIASDTLFVSKGYGIGAAVFKVVRGDKSTAPWKVTEVWHNPQVLRTKFTNCVLAGDHVFGLDDGTLECVDLATGTKLWKSGRYGSGQILLAGDVLLVQAESGEVVLVEDNSKKFSELTRFPAIEGKTWADPTLAGRYLLTRNAEEAACYELPVVEE